MTTANERAPSDRLMYAARPTIRVAGRADERVSELLLSMTMTEQEGGMSALELRFSNVASHPDGGASLAFEDDRVLRLGAALTVYAGDQERPQEIFRGAVTGLELELSQEAPPELVVLAEDALQRARLQRRTQLRRNVRLAGLADELAREAGLRRAAVTGFQDDIGPQMQLNESNLAFLRRLLRAYDGDLQVVGDELHVAPRSEVRRDELTLEMFSQLRRVRVTADLAHQATAVTVSGWDPAQARRIRYASAGRALGPGRGQRGSQLLQRALGARSEHAGHVAVVNEREARAMADALYDQRARRFILAEGTAEGNAGLRVGAHVTLRGMSDRFDNTFYVTKVCHRFNARLGYQTDFEAECAYYGGGAA
jgi:phage protein D